MFKNIVKNKKKGYTLIEVIAVVCILGILSALSVTSIFAASREYTLANKISQGQRSAANAEKIIKLYAKSAIDMDFMTADLPTVNATFSQDKDFIFANDYSGTKEIAVKYADPSSSTFKVMNYFGDISSIDFEVKQLSSDNEKYMLNYTIVTNDSYTLKGGIVLNNISTQVYTSMNPKSITIDTSSLDNRCAYFKLPT